MVEKLVSIIMPSYNTDAYISYSIKSVLKQTYQEWELIIIDDCSVDRTDVVVKPFLKDKRIKYFKNHQNLGAAISRNRALREAKGRWVAFLDSDDIWLPNKLKNQIKFMTENKYFFSYTEYIEIDELGGDLNVRVTGPEKITKSEMYQYCWPGCLTVMYDRMFLGDIKVENLKKNNDYAMWLKISKKTNCYLYRRVTAKYRRRKGSISNHSYISLIKWHYLLFRQVEKFSVIMSICYTLRNLFWGVMKKILYVERENMINIDDNKV